MKQKLILHVKVNNPKDRIAVKQLIGSFPSVESSKPVEGDENKYEVVGIMINTHKLLKKLKKYSKEVCITNLAPNGMMGLPFMAGPMYLPPPPPPPPIFGAPAQAQMTMTPYGMMPIVPPPIWPTTCFNYTGGENGAPPTHPFNPPPPPLPPLVPIGGGAFGELGPSQGGYGYPPQPYNPYYYGQQQSYCSIM